MKRRYVFVLAALLALGGCSAKQQASNAAEKSSANETTVVDNRKKDEKVSFSEDDFDTQGWYCKEKYGSSSYYFLEVKNNSKATVGISGNATALDGNDSVLGSADGSIDVLGPGETSLMTFYFSDVGDVTTVKTDLQYTQDIYYQPVISNLKVNQSINDKNVTIQVTNNGDVPAEFVEATALFFDAEGNVIYHNSGYVADNDSEIKPGATLSDQLDSYEAFDHVNVYLNGRADKSAKAADSSSSKGNSSVTDSDFDITEYTYSNDIARSSMYFLVIKNNSEKTVGIDGNMTAYDGSGNVIGAADGSIDVLAPEEESIATFYFNDVTGIDHVDYKLNYDTAPYYTSGLKDLKVEENINSKNVVVTVTNNGTEASQFVEAHALLFDSQGNVISYESTYVVDDDSVIKPGATISKQIDSYKPFDTVKVYLTGRR